MPDLKPAVIRDLQEHGLSVVDKSTGAVSCDTCGATWTIDTVPGGKLPPRWWSCPNRCNQ